MYVHESERQRDVYRETRGVAKCSQLGRMCPAHEWLVLIGWW